MKIEGLWQLRRRRQGETGPETSRGYLRYTSEGRMEVVIMAGMQGQELLTSYSGKYKLQEGVVCHHPQVGFSPSGLAAKIRFYTISEDGECLTLSTFSNGSKPQPGDQLLEFYRLDR